MNGLQKIELIEGDIFAVSTRESFASVLSDESVVFDREANFACQIIAGNEYLAKTAMQNRQSVVDAMVNLASIGLTLNPAKKLAYLVPRDKAVKLDISYMGLIELAISSGSVLFAQAHLVHEFDEFELVGPDKAPIHKRNVFARLEDRGPIVGAYCYAKLPGGDFITETMSLEAVYEIRDRSESYKAYKDGRIKSTPWVDDEGEMIRKTVVKRAHKYWPKSDRLSRGIEYINENGEGLASLAASKDAAAGALNVQHYCDQIQRATSLEAVEKIYTQAAAEAVRLRDAEGGSAVRTAARRRYREIQKGGADDAEIVGEA